MRKPVAEKLRSREDLVNFGRSNLTAFARWPLGMRGRYELWKCQREWLSVIQDAYYAKLRDHDLPEDDPTKGQARHLVILAPSEHGKTTGMVLPFVLWVLARNRNLRVMVAGSKDTLAQNIGFGVDRHFANRPDDIASFGLIQGTPWKSEEKYVQRDNDNLIHPSMIFVGPESEFQGKRADVIVVTDLCTFKNMRTPESRAKIADWFHETLEPRLEPWGFILVEGHRVDADDFYSELEEDGDYRVMPYRAIVQDRTAEQPEKVLASEQWTYGKLCRMRERKPVWFSTVMQNSPRPKQTAVSRESLERCFDRSRPMLTHLLPEVRAAYKEIQMRLDPAFAINRWNSHSACHVVGVTETGQRDVLAGWRLKLLPHQLKAKFVTTALTFKPDVMYVEANAAQILLVEAIKEKLGPELARKVVPVYTVTNEQTPEDSVEQGVSDIVVLMESGAITLPYRGLEAQTFSEQFVAEIVSYPPANKHRSPDVLMAFHVGERGMRKIEKNSRRTIRTGGLVRSVAAARRGSLPITTDDVMNQMRGNA